MEPGVMCFFWLEKQVNKYTKQMFYEMVDFLKKLLPWFLKVAENIHQN